MKTGIHILLLFSSCILLQGCSEEIENATSQNGSEYLPLALGNEWIYDQTQIAYEISGFDTTHFQSRERVIAADTSEIGVINYTLEQSFRIDEVSNWQIESLFTIRVSKDWIITQKGSEVVTQLDLPVLLNKTWDYNSHNTASTMTVRYSEKEDEFAESFEPIFEDQGEEIFIILSDTEQNIVNQDQQYERYIAGVGLVEKKSIILEFCTVNCETSGQINTGSYLNKKLISYNVGE